MNTPTAPATLSAPATIGMPLAQVDTPALILELVAESSAGLEQGQAVARV